MKTRGVVSISLAYALPVAVVALACSAPHPAGLAPSATAVAATATPLTAAATTSPLPCVRVGGPVREPRKLRHVPVRLPDAVRRIREGLPFQLLAYEARIDESGSIADIAPVEPVSAESPWPEINEAAVRAIRQWRYASTHEGGKAVSVCLTVTVRIEVRL
jgi:hypothetical protein